MAKKPIIRVGDKTDHGGEVTEGYGDLTIYGKSAAGVGHRGYCRKCKKEFVIIEGVENVTYMGRNVAVEGMRTSCGAILIASQSEATIDVPTGSATHSRVTSSNGAADSVIVKTAVRAASQPAQNTKYNERFILLDDATNEPLAKRQYAIQRESGAIEYGTTDAAGYTITLSLTDAAEEVHIYVAGADMTLDEENENA